MPAVPKSTVSRRLVAATETAMVELLSRDLSELDAAVLMIDGVHFAEEVLVVALMTTIGTKIAVGLSHGDTENAAVVKTVLADLVDRGLRYEAGLLVMLDGSKALRKGRVLGLRGQGCRAALRALYKRRNGRIGLLPDSMSRRHALAVQVAAC